MSALLWFVEYVTPHLLSGEIIHVYFSLRHLVSYEDKREMICLVFLPELMRSFTSSLMVDWLSLYIIFLSIVYPWDSIKYRVYIIYGIWSCVTTSSPLVEMSTFSFRLLELLRIDPFPSDIISPLCHLLSQWELYEAYTYHPIKDIFSNVSFNFICLVKFRCFSNLFNFPQSSSSGCLNLVVINATAVWISLRDRLHMNSSCDVVWWKFWACSSGRYLAAF